MEHLNGRGSRRAGAKTTRKVNAEPLAPTTAETVRADFGLAVSTFAKMVHVPAAVLGGWEKGLVSLDADAEQRIGRVAAILEGLAQVIRRTYVAIWLVQPNDACKEIGAHAPLDLFKCGDYEAVEDMVFYLESGSPG
jgi:DNA-binding transcriptional regulator YiaG